METEFMTTKITLTHHQRCVLQAASRSANLNAWPLPQRLCLSKGSATIVAKGLLKKGLIAERAALGHDAIWRETEDGRPMTLIITKAGLAAVGMHPEVASDRKQAADETAQKAQDEAKRGPTAPVSQNQQRRPRGGSKLAMLVELLGRNEGATIEEMVAVLKWQQHTIRGVMSGALAKKFGLQIVSEVTEGRGRVYRTTGAAEADGAEVDGARE
jgi:hypothetical protein